MLIFLKLLFVHLVFDFLLQPKSWIDDRISHKIKSTSALLHAFLHGLFAWVILLELHLWWVGVLIFITHWLIDVWKSYQKNNLQTFLLDQLIHVLVLITATVLVIAPGQIIIQEKISTMLSSTSTLVFLAFSTGFILLLRPTSLVLKYFMTRFELEERDIKGLDNAGQWIGYFERIIILVSVMMGAYTVLGFLVASKSLLRFGETEQKTRKHTEYVLVGSLLSWGIGLLIAVSVQLLITGKFTLGS